VAQLAAESWLEAVGDALVLARFRLALGQLAADRFPDATRAASSAEQWFAERGAADYVERYRKAARRSALRRPESAGEQEEDRPEPASVRASG
jgi:hypothetical protein